MTPYQCSGFVLPTEAEWEYAARSGTEYNFWTPDGGGNYSANTCTGNETIQDGVNSPLLSEYAWYCANNQWSNSSYSLGSKEAAQLLPNGFGLHDMHGNVWEFCQRPGDDQGKTKVIRGGSWGTKAEKCRSGYRGRSSWTRGNDIGFRVARDL